MCYIHIVHVVRYYPTTRQRHLKIIPTLLDPHTLLPLRFFKLCATHIFSFYS